MKKNQLTPPPVNTTETLQHDSGQKRSERDIVMNYILLTKEFLALGLPPEFSAASARGFWALSGEEYVLDFDMRVAETPVKGRIHMEANAQGDFYAISYYELVLKNLANAGGERNNFLYTPFSLIRIEEAVNLMQHRCIYRKPEIDPIREGGWYSLGPVELLPGFRRLELLRNGFQVSEYLCESGLGSWLGLEGWNKLIADLEKGYRCDLAVDMGRGMQTVKVEADPFQQRLKVTNGKGMEIDHFRKISKT